MSKQNTNANQKRGVLPILLLIAAIFFTVNAIFTSYHYLTLARLRGRLEPAFFGFVALPIILWIVYGIVMLCLRSKDKSDRFSASATPVAAPAQAPLPMTTNASTADELKKFKELLDAGILTQEEFDAKKRQLLGL